MGKGCSGEDTMHLFFLWIGEGFGGKYSEAPKAFAKPEAAEGFTKHKEQARAQAEPPQLAGANKRLGELHSNLVTEQECKRTNYTKCVFCLTLGKQANRKTNSKARNHTKHSIL